MPIAPQEQAGIVELLSGIYRRILPIEGQWRIRQHGHDMRPRIEHFHDAVRALTSGSASLYEKNSRLSVEHLAYDIGQLRLIQDKPAGKLNRATEQSAGADLVPLQGGNAHAPKLPPAAQRQELAALYREYMVLFAALFAEVADRNYQSRIEAIDGAVEDLALLEQVIQQLARGAITQGEALEEILHVERDDLRERLQQLLANKKLSAKDRAAALALIGAVERGMDQERQAIETAHLHYATGQLAIYEQHKEMIQRFAVQGLNLAGRFLESAMQAAARGRGRGV